MNVLSLHSLHSMLSTECQKIVETIEAVKYSSYSSSSFPSELRMPRSTAGCQGSQGQVFSPRGGHNLAKVLASCVHRTVCDKLGGEGGKGRCDQGPWGYGLPGDRFCHLSFLSHRYMYLS